jgi:dTDP-4-dehydrorhamnose reductase
MKVLLIGATGMLGQAIGRRGRERGLDIIIVARSGADRDIDVADPRKLVALINDLRPDVLVNSAAIVDLGACERDPGLAYRVNARASSDLAHAARAVGGKYVFVSTDHYWRGDRDRKHDERAPVTLINEYARSKYLGEALSLITDNALVLRTNIVGRRRKAGAPTFAEWAIGALTRREPLTLFDDVFTSSMHVDHFADAMFDLLDRDPVGVLNLASSEVSSKRAFVAALAAAMEIELDWAETGSGADMQPPRADSMGLDVSRAEALIGRALPDLRATVTRLVEEWRDGGDSG